MCLNKVGAGQWGFGLNSLDKVMSITFDEIIPAAVKVLREFSEVVDNLEWMVINRDLNGKVRFIIPDEVCSSNGKWLEIYKNLSDNIGAHAYDQKSGILYEKSLDIVRQGASYYRLDEFKSVWVVDRLATEGNWSSIAPASSEVCRVVFFSIKGGVGRSTALAATAWSLAQDGKRVLVLDLDLESPGLSSTLLPQDRMPKYGIVDWLVEDLVGNSDPVLGSMYASSNLSRDGQIYVVPAHGLDHGEYISKLGRVWMSKNLNDGSREVWSSRLNRLLAQLEKEISPDVILIDSRSGIDEIASACITDMGANLVLLFALEGVQTWNGYRMLFEQWQRSGIADDIRTRLQVVGAIVPETDRVLYTNELRESSYSAFLDTLYDEIAPASKGAVGKIGSKAWHVGEVNEGWSFDEFDCTAPHYPWIVYWNSGFTGLFSIQGRLVDIDEQEVRAVFGKLIEGVNTFSSIGKSYE